MYFPKAGPLSDFFIMCVVPAKLSLIFGERICCCLNLIACTSPCIYQQDGYCTLDRALSLGMPSPKNPCINFQPQLQNGSQRFPDIFDRD